MARKKFTDPWIRGLKKAAPGTRDLWSDKAETGLSLMVNDKGRVTFLLFTRFPKADGSPGNPSRRVLGTISLATTAVIRGRSNAGWISSRSKRPGSHGTVNGGNRQRRRSDKAESCR